MVASNDAAQCTSSFLYFFATFSNLTTSTSMEASLDWDSIVETLGPKLYRYFVARFDDLLADDLTQETLVRLVSKFNRGEYDNQKGSIDMWAFGIARFVRLEEIRRSRKSSTQTVSYFRNEEESSFMNNQEKKSELNHLRFSIGYLPEPQQEIILLMIDKDMSIQDISDHLDMPVGTVKSHTHRAKKALFSLFTKTLGGPNGRQI